MTASKQTQLHAWFAQVRNTTFSIKAAAANALEAQSDDAAVAQLVRTTWAASFQASRDPQHRLALLYVVHQLGQTLKEHHNKTLESAWVDPLLEALRAMAKCPDDKTRAAALKMVTIWCVRLGGVRVPGLGVCGGRRQARVLPEGKAAECAAAYDRTAGGSPVATQGSSAASSENNDANRALRDLADQSASLNDQLRQVESKFADAKVVKDTGVAALDDLLNDHALPSRFQRDQIRARLESKKRKLDDLSKQQQQLVERLTMVLDTQRNQQQRIASLVDSCATYLGHVGGKRPRLVAAVEAVS